MILYLHRLFAKQNWWVPLVAKDTVLPHSSVRPPTVVRLR
jgi:hypothetical protein